MISESNSVVSSSRQIESICTKFETAWRKGRGPRIEDFLSIVADDIKGRLFAELLAVELELRLAEPSLPQLSDYIERFAQHAELVERTFRSVTEDCQAEKFQIESPATSTFQMAGDDRRHQLGDEIARGGMGVVYRCRDTALGRELALKTLLPQHQRKIEAILRFENEAGITARLQHPGVPPVHELGRLDDGRPFLTMRLVEGQTLAEMLHEAGNEALSERRRRLLEILRDVCETVAYAHAREVIHRDLKPSNVMVGAFGEVQVMDWGLAKELDTRTRRSGEDLTADARSASEADSEARSVSEERSSKTADSLDSPLEHSIRAGDTDVLVTSPGLILGTLSYMPPEQAQGANGELDKRADVFSLGAMLCEILTGDPPYRNSEGSEKVGLPSEAVDSPSAVSDGLHAESVEKRLEVAHQRLHDCGAARELIGLARDCLEADPVQRPADAAVIAARLDDHLQSVDERLRQAELDRATAETKAGEARKRVRVLRLLVGLLVVAVAAAIVAVFAFQRLAHQREQARVAASLQRKFAQEAQASAERAEATAAQQRDAARAAEATARAARHDAETALADLYTQSGMVEARLGDTHKAVLFFAAAARQAHGDARRRWANRVRVQTFSRDLPKPAALLHCETPIDRIRFHPAAPYVILRTLHQPRDMVWGWETERPASLPEQCGEVRAAAWSADGSQLAIGNERGEIFLCHIDGDAKSPFALRDRRGGATLAGQNPTTPISQLVFDQTGRYLAVAAGRLVRVWDADQNGWRAAAWELPAEVADVQFNSPRQEVVTCAADNRFRIFAMDRQSAGPVFEGNHFCDRRGTTFLRPAISPDGKWMLTAEQQIEIAIWDLDSRSERYRGHSTSAFPYAVRVRADGKVIGIAGQIGISAISPAGERVMPYRARQYTFSCDFTRDGHLVSGGVNHRAEVWSTDEDGQRIGAAALNSSDIRALEYSANGRWLAMAEPDGRVRVWRISDDRPRHVQIPTVTQYCFARFTSDGRYVMPTARIASDGKPKYGTRVFASDTGKPAGPELASARLPYREFSPDDRLVAMVAPGDAVSVPGVASLWDWNSGRRVHSVETPSDPIMCKFRPDGEQLAVLSRAGMLCLIDVDKGEVTAKWKSGYGHLPTAARTPLLEWIDVQTLLCFRDTNAVVAWDVVRQSPRFGPWQHEGNNIRACLSADRSILATGGNDGLVKLWNLQTGTLAGRPLEHPAAVYSLAFSSDGRWLATGCRDFHARVWSTKTGKLSGPAIASRDAPHVGWAAGSGALLVGTHYFGQFNAYDWRIGQPLQPRQLYFGLDSIDTDPRGRFVALGKHQRHMDLLDLDDLLDIQELAVWPDLNEHPDRHRAFLDRLSDDELVTWAELLSNQRMGPGGVTSNMTSDEWRRRWQSIQFGE